MSPALQIAPQGPPEGDADSLRESAAPTPPSPPAPPAHRRPADGGSRWMNRSAAPQPDDHDCRGGKPTGMNAASNLHARGGGIATTFESGTGLRRGSCGCDASGYKGRRCLQRGRWRHRIHRARDPFHHDPTSRVDRQRRHHTRGRVIPRRDVRPATTVPGRIRRAWRRSCRGDPSSWPQAPAQGRRARFGYES